MNSLSQLVEALLRVVDLLHVPQGEAHASEGEVRSLAKLSGACFKLRLPVNLI